MKRGKAIIPLILVAALFITPEGYAADTHDNYCSWGKESNTRPQMHDLWQKLPEEKRQLLHNMMINVDKQNDALKVESKKLLSELKDLLTAPTFNKSQYLNKSAKLGALQAKIKANLSDAFTEIAGHFNQQEREILAKMDEIRHHHLLDEATYCHNDSKERLSSNDAAKKYTH